MQDRSRTPFAERIKRFLGNGILCLVSVAVALTVGEVVLRYRYAALIDTPSPEGLAIQSHLRINPDTGYTWEPDVDASRNININRADSVRPPLSTDEWGFLNAPEAIKSRRSSQSADVVGVGDSFMEHAAFAFYEALRSEHMSYYSLAMHRYCPPQYTTLVQTRALKMEPRWVVYGLFENDFGESTDYDDWRNSGLDWFTYHSGTWCGQAIGQTWPERLVKRHLPGYNALYRVIHSRLRGERMSVVGPSPSQVFRVCQSVESAARSCSDSGVRFLLLLIPSKGTALHEPTHECRAYDEVVRRTASLPVDILDLRPVFRSVPNPTSLYYKVDGHWNSAGIQLATDQLVAYLLSH